MKKIVLSVCTAMTLGVITLCADANTLHQDSNEQASTSKEFFDRFHAKGDFRVRHEIIEKHGTTANKNRERFRFRYALNIDITDNIVLETGISNGKYNPTSGNVTFRDDEKFQDYFAETLKIDIADIKYSFDNAWIRLGKSKNKIYRPIKTQLIWDGDLRLEGINYGYKNTNTLVNLGVNRVHREKGNKGADSHNITMFLAQYVHTQKLDNAKLNLGLGYYHYDGVQGASAPYGKTKNNSEDINGLYAEDYGIVEVFAELKCKDVMGIPFKTALSLAYNAQVNDDNLAYDIGAQFGAAKKVGQLQVGVGYRDIEKDAVFGAHTDSDFSGGGTDSKGYFVRAKYKFAENVYLAAWWNSSKLGDTNREYKRTQLDLSLKF